jgi:hypothetical protein
MSFTQIADGLLLSSAKVHLTELQWDVEADGYLRIPFSSLGIDEILRLLPRRGLQPKLVLRLLEQFSERPLERALIAWDVARGALLGADDGDLAQRLFSDLAALKPLGATTKAAVPRDRVATLVEAARPSNALAAIPDDFANVPSLTVLAGLASSRENLDGIEAVVEATIAHAKRLSLAHLPSLALAFMQVLWDRFAVMKALDLLVEVGLDYGLLESIPAMAEQDEVSLRRQAYVAVRAKLAAYDVIDAGAMLDLFESLPALRGASDPRLTISRAELELLKNKQFEAASLQRVEALAPPDSDWRYGAYVRDAVKMQNASYLAASLVEGHIPSFGNNVRLWRRAGRHADARAALLALLSRELRYVSHDPEVWRALAFFGNDRATIEAEVEERLQSQLAATLS